MRSIAKWVLPVLVGPRTAVTPAPGNRSLENNGADDDRDIIQSVRITLTTQTPQQATQTTPDILKCLTMQRFSRCDLSFGTGPERKRPESLTQVVFGFVHRNISRK